MLRFVLMMSVSFTFYFDANAFLLFIEFVCCREIDSTFSFMMCHRHIKIQGKKGVWILNSFLSDYLTCFACFSEKLCI